MPSLDFESDALLVLLTDALRAGPGSPQWHQALERLKVGQTAEASQHALLLDARESLASGLGYRAVRPGPGFDHKVLTAIEQEAARPAPRQLPVANLIAVLSAVAIIAIVLGVGWAVWRGRGPQQLDLAQTYFTEELAAVSLDASPPAPWRVFGPLPLEFAQDSPRGMRPAPRADAAEFVAGGIVWSEPLPATQSLEVEVAIRLPAAPAGDVLAQVFVTDQVDVEGDGATAPRELVVLLRGSEVSVVAPSGRVSGQSLVVAEGQRDLRVRMMLNRTETIVVAGDQRLYAGLHELDPRAARHIGVRLLSRQARPADGPSVQSIRLKTPRGPDDPGMEVRE